MSTTLNHTTFRAPHYGLSLNGFISPEFMNRRTPAIITITEPRTCSGYGMRFTLNVDAPDLPVGETAELKLDRHFYLVLCRDAARETAERDAYRQARDQHLQSLAETTKNARWQTMLTAINAPIEMETLVGMVESCSKRRQQAYYQMKNSRYQDAAAQFAAEEAQYQAEGEFAALEKLIAELVNRLNQQGHQLISEYAYSPKEGCGDRAYNPGADHITTQVPLYRGNFKREPGDALCKTRSKFYSLSPLHDRPIISCSKCLSLLFSMYAKQNMHIGRPNTETT